MKPLYGCRRWWFIIIVYYATGVAQNGYIQTYIKIIKHTRLKWLKVNTMLKTCPYHILHHTFTVLYCRPIQTIFWCCSPNISNCTLNLQLRDYHSIASPVVRNSSLVCCRQNNIFCVLVLFPSAEQVSCWPGQRFSSSFAATQPRILSSTPYHFLENQWYWKRRTDQHVLFLRHSSFRLLVLTWSSRCACWLNSRKGSVKCGDKPIGKEEVWCAHYCFRNLALTIFFAYG